MGMGPGGLGVVRSLVRLGVEVYSVYPSKSADVGRHSRSLSGRYPVASPGSDTQYPGHPRAHPTAREPRAAHGPLPDD